MFAVFLPVDLTIFCFVFSQREVLFGKGLHCGRNSRQWRIWNCVFWISEERPFACKCSSLLIYLRVVCQVVSRVTCLFLANLKTEPWERERQKQNEKLLLFFYGKILWKQVSTIFVVEKQQCYQSCWNKLLKQVPNTCFTVSHGCFAWCAGGHQTHPEGQSDGMGTGKYHHISRPLTMSTFWQQPLRDAAKRDKVLYGSCV